MDRICLCCRRPFKTPDPKARHICDRCNKRNVAVGGVSVRVMGLPKVRECGYQISEVKR